MGFFEAPVLCSFLFNEFSDDVSDNGKSERQDGFSLSFVEGGEREVDFCLPVIIAQFRFFLNCTRCLMKVNLVP